MTKNYRLTENGHINAQELIGKSVRSAAGKRLGKVSNIVIDRQTITIAGIRVDMEQSQHSYFIGHNYIHSINSKSVKLTIAPTEELKHKRVIDAKGKEVGFVKDVERMEGTNRIDKLQIKPMKESEEIQVEEEDIKEVGKQVVLSAPLEEIKEKGETT